MRTLYLHIGFHKTGSSSLQLAMKEYSQQLRSAGVEFLSLGKRGNSSGCVDVFKNNGRLSYLPNQRLEELFAAAKDGGEEAIVSAEHLCFLYRHEDIERVRQICIKYFDHIQIVAYLRRQDLQAISFKKQAARSSVLNLSSSSKLFGHSEGAFPDPDENIKIYYDYFAKMKLWEEVFGRGSLRVRDFSRSALVGGDIVSDFSELLGVRVEIPSCRVNEGVGRKQFLLTHKLLELGVAKSEINKLKPMMKADDSELYPSRRDAEQFFLGFKASNYLLNHHFLPHKSGLAFSNDFSAYPDQGNDRLRAKDLAQWLPEMFAVGIKDPAGLRDALLIGRIQSLMTEKFMDTALMEELEGLVQCLASTAHVAQVQEPWYRLLKKKKRSGR